MTAEAKGLGIGVLAISGLALWAMTRKSTATVQPPTEALLKKVVLPPSQKVVLPPLPPKQPLTEQPSISLETWQGVTPAQLATLPVNTAKEISIGGETYNPTPQPIAIGDTSFNIWGTTEYGATVVSKNDPSTYAAWEWL